jgi:hypothetical protein
MRQTQNQLRPECIFEAFEIVRRRQSAICEALESNGVPYELSGSNATYQWIASVEESAVLAFRNVEFIIPRSASKAVIDALANIDATTSVEPERIFFRDKSDRRDRWSDRALFAGERIGDKQCNVPELEWVEHLNGFRVLPHATLVQFRLVRWTLDDIVDLRDMIDIGLIDSAWPAKFSSELAMRLQHLLDTPDG